MMGRDDDLLLDERYWALSHQFCHVEQYHHSSCKDIPWWDDYIERVRKEYPADVLKKELLRIDKAEK